MTTREQNVENILKRGIITDILPDTKSFRERLLSPEPMKIYIGADPTSTALHLSHAKNYMLLEEFRKLGHEVIVLFGDFTARIGDPTDRSAARKQLSKEDVVANVKGWIKQIKPLMDFDAKVNPPRIVYNDDWLSKLTMEDVIGLCSHFTVQQMLERDMFEKRMKEQKPIYLHEFMYPLMQGYDSVALEVDVELCGTDQTFNALVGRTLLKKLKQKDKFVVSVNLMENPVTGELMSKSRGTGVFLNFSAFDMYGSIMSQPDEMIRVFFANNTRVPLDEIETIMAGENPRDAKMRAAFEITKIFQGEEQAAEAQNNFISRVQNKEIGGDIEEVHMGAQSILLYEALRKSLGEGFSNTEIRRLIKQTSVKVDGVTADNADSILEIPAQGLALKVGKKKWFKIIP